MLQYRYDIALVSLAVVVVVVSPGDVEEDQTLQLQVLNL